MVLDDFSGGKNIRVTPSKIQATEAQIYTNIDNTSGALSPLKGPLATGVIIDKWFTYYYGNSEWVSRSVDSDFVEYRDKLYISNGGDLEEYSEDGGRSVGIVGPTDTIPISVIDFGAENVTISHSGPGTLATNGSFLYRISFYSTYLDKIVYVDYSYTIAVYSADGYNIRIDIENLNSSYISVGDTITVYRNTTTGYKKVGSVAYATAGVTIVDSIFNISSNNSLPSSYSVDTYNYVYTYYDSSTGRESTPSLPSDDFTYGIGSVTIGAIPHSSDLTETNVDTIRVYRIGGLLTQYTLLDELAYPTVATTPYIDTKEDVDIVGNEVLDSVYNEAPLSGLKYITEAYAMLFAALDDKLYYSDIAKPYAWPSTNFIDFEGDITGIGVISTGVLVFTKFKTYIVTGNSPSSFSKYLFSGSQGCISHKSIKSVANNLLWLSEDGICATTGGDIEVVSLSMLGKLEVYEVYNCAVLDKAYYVSYKEGVYDYLLCFDFRYNTIVKDLDVTGTHVVAAKDNLYQYYNGTLIELLVDEDLTMHYKSGVLTDGEYSNYKTYKDVFIRYNGDITFNIYLDGSLINSKSLTGNTTYNLKLSGITKGYGIEFEVIGTGTVYEIKYNTAGSQNV